MQVIYASRKGHVEGIVNKLGITDAIKIIDGTEEDLQQIRRSLSQL